MSTSLRALHEQADAAFACKDWARAGGLWSRVATEFDNREYRIGDVALNASVAKRLACLTDHVEALRRYHEERSRSSTDRRPRIAVFTSIVGGYDSVKVPQIPDPRFDYILFSEAAISGGGLWDVRPVTASNCSAARASRYVKMHPHRLLLEYDIAIWVDSNVMVLGDLYPLVEKFLAAPEPVGAIQHPHRENIYQEVLGMYPPEKGCERPDAGADGALSQRGFRPSRPGRGERLDVQARGHSSTCVPSPMVVGTRIRQPARPTLLQLLPQAGGNRLAPAARTPVERPDSSGFRLCRARPWHRCRPGPDRGARRGRAATPIRAQPVHRSLRPALRSSGCCTPT